MGGGLHGHLGLILNGEEYQRISNTPYERPTHPDNLEILDRTTQHEAARLRTEHKEAKKLFRQTNDLKKALRHQITAAVPKAYLDALRSREASAIT